MTNFCPDLPEIDGEFEDEVVTLIYENGLMGEEDPFTPDPFSYPLLDDTEPKKPLLSPNTCHVLIERYNLPERPKYIFPFEQEQMEERLTLGNHAIS